LDYLYGIHPEYSKLADLPQGGLTFGSSLLFSAIKTMVPATRAFVPPMNEIYHYPYLCVGWFGLFVTALNLIPVGQLDGGHIARAMFARFHNQIGQATLLFLVMLGTLGILPILGYSVAIGWIGWLVWGIILAVALRARRHTLPDQEDIESMGRIRTIFGWLCLIIFVTCFAPTPFFELP
jgi:Zn-dependent protease